MPGTTNRSHEQSVWISSADNETLPQEVQVKLDAAGFSWLKDRAGWARWRRGETVAALRDAGPLETQAEILVRDLVVDLHAVGLVNPH